MNVEAKIPKKYVMLTDEDFDPIRYFEKHYKLINFLHKFSIFKPLCNMFTSALDSVDYYSEILIAEMVFQMNVVISDKTMSYEKYYAISMFRDLRCAFIKLFDPSYDEFDKTYNYNRVKQYIDVNPDRRCIRYSCKYIDNFSDALYSTDNEEKDQYDESMRLIFSYSKFFSRDMDQFLNENRSNFEDGGNEVKWEFLTHI